MSVRETRRRKTTNMKRRHEANNSRSPITSPDEDESDEDDFPGGYHQISIQVNIYINIWRIYVSYFFAGEIRVN